MKNARFWKKVVTAVVTVAYVIADLLDSSDKQNDTQQLPQNDNLREFE